MQKTSNPIHDKLQQLTLEQRAELEKHLLRLVKANPNTAIPRRAEGDALPLSFAQQRLWFIQQLAPHSAFYNMPTALHLRGTLNVVALEDALNHLIQRHEPLRTIFPATNGVPVQHICTFTPTSIPIVDLSHLPDPERTAKLQQQLRQATLQPFDLPQEGPLRAMLYRLADQDHLFLTVKHHIASDGWSTEIFRRELWQSYQAFCQGQAPQLGTLPIQYADFALWQRNALETGQWQEQLAYWKEQLSGELPVLALPTDRPRPSHAAAVTTPGAKTTLCSPATLTAALKALGQQENATLFMTVFSALTVLLCRYAGQGEVIIGTPIANRKQAAIEGLIGFFANTLPLRTDLRDDPTVRQLLARSRRLTLAAYANQDIPFEKIVEAVQPVRDLDRQTIFQVLFVFTEGEQPLYALPDLTVEPLAIDKGVAEFDLMVEVAVTSQGLRTTLHYRTDLFEAATIQRMATHFQNLLTAMVATPDCPVSRLPLLTTAEEAQLLYTWNQTAFDNGPDLLLHRLIEAQCRQQPAHLALVYRDIRLSYDELNRQANQLAHLLCEQGVGPGTLVAICLPRTPQAAVALLAVLKAGGAFLLLDPDWPAARLAFMLEQAKVAFVVANGATAQPLHANNATINFLCIDAESAALAQQPTHNPANAVSPEQMAYVVYTSGSTGTPKGVMCTHQGLANYALFFGRMVQLTPQDHRLQFSSVGSEHFIAEVINTLCGGATLYFRPHDAAPSISEFLQLLNDYQITISALPVAYWHQWMQALADGNAPIPRSLRAVLAGMDQVQTEPFRTWQQHMGNRIAWFNVYGPAETTCVSTSYRADFSTPQLPARIPIGRPIANVTNYILDAQMQPVPIGVAGELYIGGSGTALGYLNQPDLTAERFVANPFDKLRTGSFASDRLYRTGDFARYLPSGDIEFLGRRDRQVKIRGYRIELSEVEMALRHHPAVADVAVMAQEDESGAKRLVAYIVRESVREVENNTGSTVTADDFRRFLADNVPAYMIPAAFAMLEAIPRTGNGKVDQAALTEHSTQLDFTTETSAADIVPPNTPLEIALVAIWSELLGVERVGIHTNFFALGGHSLLAVRLLAEIERQFAAKPALHTFFQEPTIAHLAHLLAQDELGHADTVQTVEADLSALQRQAIATITQELLDPTIPQSWRHIFQQDRWSSRRRHISALLRALPYPLVYRGLALLCGSERWARYTSAKQIMCIRSFLVLMAQVESVDAAQRDPQPVQRPSEEEIIARSLLYRYLHHYQITPHPNRRAHAQSVQRPDIAGLELLTAAKAAGHGVLLVFMHHSSPARLDLSLVGPAYTVGGIHLYLEHCQIKSTLLQNSLFAMQLHTARRILLDGGIVAIAPDGHRGTSAAVEMDFLGRRRPFYTGFAELALMTDAVVLAVTATIDAHGKTQYQFVGPLDSGEETMPHAKRIEHLVSQYVEHLHCFWAKTPWMVPWYQMERHLAYPPSAG